ncbi:MAG: Lpg1974 family pore-forming outer membrane protein, partial [Planctomycetota bacterium]
AAGLRFAEIEQNYLARLNDENGTLQGTIDYSQKLQGVGPVVGVRFGRPCVGGLSLFGLARGSVLFGDGDSNLLAQEDLDLAETLTTTAITAGDDILPIGEMQLGLQWLPTTTGCLHPYFHVAMEGQVWGGAGNASSQSGNVGFYGVNFALGFDW